MACRQFFCTTVVVCCLLRAGAIHSTYFAIDTGYACGFAAQERQLGIGRGIVVLSMHPVLGNETTFAMCAHSPSLPPLPRLLVPPSPPLFTSPLPPPRPSYLPPLPSFSRHPLTHRIKERAVAAAMLRAEIESGREEAKSREASKQKAADEHRKMLRERASKYRQDKELAKTSAFAR